VTASVQETQQNQGSKTAPQESERFPDAVPSRWRPSPNIDPDQVPLRRDCSANVDTAKKNGNKNRAFTTPDSANVESSDESDDSPREIAERKRDAFLVRANEAMLAPKRLSCVSNRAEQPTQIARNAGLGPNPHSLFAAPPSRGSAFPLPPDAISCLSAFRTPAGGASGEISAAGVRKPAH
jgi:hypothetical protein